ncbi:hypothetical protein ACJO1Y_23705 [Vibrio parahaemolyticus]|uniref:hypothetical protein n=1 Tax=Vibrio parahaemolyticus TaxID=670 RepID=UPI00235DEAB0|nr:hypothetical protein [Vibrio parahaemolyticus]
MNFLIVGLNGNVISICPFSGEEIWRTKIGSGHVSTLQKEGVVIAGCNRHVFGLRAENCEVIWENNLPGAGYGNVSLNLENSSVQYQETEVVREVIVYR